MTNLDMNPIINLEKYPIQDINCGAGRVVATSCRQQYLQSGLCELPDFILPTALDRLIAQANTQSQHAYFCNSTHNAYLTNGDSSLSKDNLQNRQETTFVGSVAYDYISENSLLKTIYMWDPLKDFIGHVLNKKPFFRFADPLGACSINVFVDGGQHGWHFDESEYIVTLMLQPPQQGGEFEYVPMIRNLENEKELVTDILNGDRTNVKQLSFKPGTLLIFGGYNTLHRVNQVTGSKPRLVPVLCYADKPNLKNSEAVRKLFWGRTAQAG